jgi:CBS domain-containing protein
VKVRDIMATPPVVVAEDATLEDIARLMLQHGIGCVPIVDSRGKLTGIITESDFTGKERGVPFSAYRAPQLFGAWVPREGVERIYAAARTLRARDIMTSPVVTAREDESVSTLVERMIRYDITRVPVVRNGIPVGVVARYDLLKVLLHTDA